MAKARRSRGKLSELSYKGGFVQRHPSGYLLEHCPDFPTADSNGMVRQHRLIMADLIGRPLLASEIVHHKNRDRADNRPENLELTTRAGHLVLHYEEDGSKTALPLTETQVRAALKGRTTKEAAKLLGCHPMTLYNRFDHLLKKRRTPKKADDPAVIAAVLEAASDPLMSKPRFEAATGISQNLIETVCIQQGVEWVQSIRYGGPLYTKASQEKKVRSASQGKSESPKAQRKPHKK